MHFGYESTFLGQNNEGVLPNTFLSSQTKNGEKNFKVKNETKNFLHSLSVSLEK